MSTPELRLDRLTTQEVKQRLDRGAVALWPVGATEAHGPHLPLDTDVLIAEHTCRLAASRCDRETGLSALILPPLAYTVTEYAQPFSGTVCLPRAAVLPYVTEVAVAVATQGFRAVVLVNAHLEPAHRFVLRDAVKAARERTRVPIGLADPCDRRWVPHLTEEFQSGACHAGQYETSLVLAAAPERVDTETAQTLPDSDVDLMGAMKVGARTFMDMGATEAYVGSPRGATSEEGEASFRTLAWITLEVIRECLDSEEEESK